MLYTMKYRNQHIITGSIIGIILLFATPLLLFGALLSGPPITNYFNVQSYQQGQCKILSKQIINYGSYDQNSGSDSIQYAPDFKFTVQNASTSYSAAGYGIDQHMLSEETDAQAILNQYQIGGTYTCWYDQTHPSHAILTREVTEWILLLPGSIMLLIGLGLLIGGGTIIRKLGLLMTSQRRKNT